MDRKRLAFWRILPVGFFVLLVMWATAIALAFARGFGDLERVWIFNIGLDIFGIAICVVLFYACMRSKDSAEETTYLFVAMLITNGIALFLDECAWLVQGLARLRVWNIVINVVFYANGVILLYQFWRYIRVALGLGEKTKILTVVLQVAVVPAVLLCYANLFVPLYFQVDAMGVYRRTSLFPLSYLYACVLLGVIVKGLRESNAQRYQKLVVVSFVAIPVGSALITIDTFGISTQYASTLIAIVLMYGVLFSERSRMLASTQFELQSAAQIQEAVLPNVFPAFPDRTEFDIFASMDPAKEVGGDFYDFFLVDNDHLCLLIADVSGKGFPAALFMMASKIILADCAKMGKTPAQILSDVNATICANNREGMFVTVWLGILEISTGKLTAANAGHEYPALARQGKGFELIKDKHGLVIGAMDGMRYREYTIQMEPGMKLFVYTDGLPEANDLGNDMFGIERMLGALNEVIGETPKNILRHMRQTVNEFVKDADQFDDLTMLCLEYKGE